MSKTDLEKKIVHPKLDLNKIVAKARASFGKTEKSLAMQISTGASISRPDKDSDFVMSRSPHWQLLTGIRGLPFGKVVQVAGRPDSGKSTTAMDFMKAAQDDGHIVILWDTEGKFAKDRFDKKFNGDSEQLLISQSRVILEGSDQIIFLVREALAAYPDKKVLVVWDSVGGTLSSSENEKDNRESMQMAQAAKENGRVMRSLVSLMEECKNKETAEEKIAILLINQSYMNIGSVGSQESGGQKVAFHSSLIVQLTRKADLYRVKDKVKRKIGILSRAKVKKNHLFDGEDSVAELDLMVTASGIKLSEGKTAKAGDNPEEAIVSDDEEAETEG